MKLDSHYLYYLGKLALTGAVILSAGCSHKGENTDRPVPEKEAALIDLFSSRISLYRQFIHDMAVSQYLAHRSLNADYVMTVHTGYNSSVEDTRTLDGTVVLGLPTGDQTTEAAVEFCVKYNLYRIMDADNAFVAGRKENAEDLLRVIADNCSPLADSCNSRIAGIQSGISEFDYSKTYLDNKIVFPAFSRVLAGTLTKVSTSNGRQSAPE